MQDQCSSFQVHCGLVVEIEREGDEVENLAGGFREPLVFQNHPEIDTAVFRHHGVAVLEVVRSANEFEGFLHLVLVVLLLFLIELFFETQVFGASIGIRRKNGPEQFGVQPHGAP